MAARARRTRRPEALTWLQMAPPTQSMASLCREFGISRVIGYKVYGRYKECGLEGLTDRARTRYAFLHLRPGVAQPFLAVHG